MPKVPKFFIGTMYSGEAEFEESRAAIAAQEGIVVEHFVLKDLPEFEAHNQLWKKWNSVKSSFDLFVKIDADTVLIGKDALLKIWHLFEANSEVTGAQILLHDYFTDSLIPGPNSFHPSVVFNDSKDPLYPDHADSGHKLVLKGESVQFLAPIGEHCKHPAKIQAFHYGLHRALKKQTEVLKKLCLAWKNKPESGRFWAIAGARMAIKYEKKFHNMGKGKKFLNRLLGMPTYLPPISYKSPAFLEAFYEAESDNELAAKVLAFTDKFLEEQHV